MSQPRFSVIIPVYNAQDTITKCVQSILCQAPNDLELILVNDGSGDNSASVCDQLAMQDTRIRVIHQQNAGASSARNAGLCAAQGQYLQFVDADDWVLPGLYDRASCLLQNNIDVLFFGVQNVGYHPEPPLPDAVYDNLSALKSQFQHYLVDTGQFAAPYNKLYRASVIGSIRFDPNLRINEDLLFNLQVLQHCQRVQFISTNYYACDHTGEGSLSRSLRTDLLDAELATRQAMTDFARHYGLSQQESDQLLNARLGNVAVAQMSILMSRHGNLSLGQYRRVFGRLLSDCTIRKALANWLAQDENRLMALPYRLCIALRFAFPMAFWCWLRCSTTHSF